MPEAHDSVVEHVAKTFKENARKLTFTVQEMSQGVPGSLDHSVEGDDHMCWQFVPQAKKEILPRIWIGTH